MPGRHIFYSAAASAMDDLVKGLMLCPAGMCADLQLLAPWMTWSRGLLLCPAGMCADLQLPAPWMTWSRGLVLCAAGMFADLQLVALRAMDDLVDAHKLVLASAAADDDAPVAYTNEWMASARWHPFWLFALAHVIRANESRCTRLGCPPSFAEYVCLSAHILLSRFCGVVQVRALNCI